MWKCIFYLMTQQRFRNERYSDPLTKENSGSAQYMLLLEEFLSLRCTSCWQAIIVAPLVGGR